MNDTSRRRPASPGEAAWVGGAATLHRRAKRLVGTQDAEDAVQAGLEGTLRTVRRGKTDVRSLEALSWVCVRHEAYTIGRRRRRARTLRDRLEAVAPMIGAATERAMRQDRVVDARRALKRLIAIMPELSPRERDVILETVAEVQPKEPWPSPGSRRTAIHTARQRLRRDRLLDSLLRSLEL